MITHKQYLKGTIRSGIIKEYPPLDTSITVAPTEEQIILRPSNYGLSEVIVEPMDITTSTDYRESLEISKDILGGVIDE